MLDKGLSMLDVIAVFPEMYIALMVIGILVYECLVKESSHKTIFLVSIFSVIGAMILAIYSYITIPEPPSNIDLYFGGAKVFKNYFWFNEIAFSKLIGVFKLSILFIVLLGLIYGYPRLKEENLNRPEYYILILLSTVGMLVLVSAASILTIYLGLELMSLPMYVLVALNRKNKRAMEAAMKYFVMGAMASGILLFGMALLYGVSGTLQLDVMGGRIIEIISNNRSIEGFDKLLLFSIAFIVVGTVFKLGAAPFHAWVPDVYEGAPVSVAMFISAAPKIAALAMGGSLLYDATYNFSQQNIITNWQTMLAMIAVTSFIIGNLAALKQTNLRRMLGYSAVSHAGFILLGLFTGGSDGYTSGAFYAITYALTTVAVFGFILTLKSNSGESIQNIDELKGLYQSYPIYAFLMAGIMLSMAGIPAFVGFQAKWYVLKSAFASGYIGTVIIGLVMSIVGLGYYLRVIKTMFFDDKPAINTLHIAEKSMVPQIVLMLNVMLLIILGIKPTLLLMFL